MTAMEALQGLDSIQIESDRILMLIGNSGISDPNIHEVQELFRTLKEILESEYSRVTTFVGRGLSEVETLYYRPAIIELWAESGIRSILWNSRPDYRWRNALANARNYSADWSFNLRSALES